MTRLIDVRYSLMNADRSFGFNASEMEVNPTISEKSTVSCSLRPSMLYFWGSWAILSTSSGGTYCPNSSVNWRLERDSTKYP